jgi:hypothetical protein
MYDYVYVFVTYVVYIYICVYIYSRSPVFADLVSLVSVIRGLPRPEKIGKQKKYTVHKFSISTGRNVVKSEAQTRPVLGWFSSFPVPTLNCQNLLLLYVREREREVHSKCTMHCTVHIITIFNVGNVLLCVIYLYLSYLCMLQEYHLIYSVRYHPRLHITVLGLGKYYPWIRGHYCVYTCVCV